MTPGQWAVSFYFMTFLFLMLAILEAMTLYCWGKSINKVKVQQEEIERLNRELDELREESAYCDHVQTME